MVLIESFQLSVAVCAVVSTFSNGASLLHALRKSRVRRRRGEEAFKEKVLLESLLTAEKSIDERYAALCKEFGRPARTGDAIVRERLLHVAVSIHPQVLRSLQLATRNHSEVLDFTTLHEASVMLRRDALEALADFRQRLADGRSSSPIIPPYSIYRTLSSSQHSTIPPYSVHRTLSSSQNSIMSGKLQRSRSSGHFSCADLSTTVTIVNGDDEKTGSVFSRPRSNSVRTPVKPARGLTRVRSAVTLSNNQSWVPSHKTDENQDRLSPLPQDPPLLEVPPRLRPLMKPLPALMKPLPAPPPPPAYSPRRLSKHIGLDVKAAESVPRRPEHPLERQARTSYDQADADISPVSEPDSRHDSAMPSPGDTKSTEELDRAFTDVAERLNMGENAEARPYSWVSSLASASSTSVYSTDASIQQDDTTVASTTYTPSHHSPSGSRTSEEVKSVGLYSAKLRRSSYASIINSTPYSEIPAAPPAAVEPVVRPTARRSIRSKYFQYGGHRHGSGEVTSPRPTTPLSSFFSNPFVGPRMQDAPCKQNDYHNLCKGAWNIREDIKKGLVVHAKPIGMYTSAMVWRCKNCAFEGPAWTKGKPYCTDPTVYTFECRVPSGPDSDTTLLVKIRYKWIFLAKSHVKVKPSSLFSRSTLAAWSMSSGSFGEAANPPGKQNLVLRGTSVSHRSWSRCPSMPSLMAGASNGYLRKTGHCFGCIFCCAEVQVTDVFDSLELMLRHVAETHAQPGVLAFDVMERTKSVAGRSPGHGEECDVWWTAVEQDS